MKINAIALLPMVLLIAFSLWLSKFGYPEYALPLLIISAFAFFISGIFGYFIPNNKFHDATVRAAFKQNVKPWWRQRRQKQTIQTDNAGLDSVSIL